MQLENGQEEETEMFKHFKEEIPKQTHIWREISDFQSKKKKIKKSIIRHRDSGINDMTRIKKDLFTTFIQTS